MIINEYSLDNTLRLLSNLAKEKDCKVSYKIKNIGSSDGVNTDSLLSVKFYNKTEEFSLNYTAIRYGNDITVYVPEM